MIRLKEDLAKTEDNLKEEIKEGNELKFKNEELELMCEKYLMNLKQQEVRMKESDEA